MSLSMDELPYGAIVRRRDGALGRVGERHPRELNGRGGWYVYWDVEPDTEEPYPGLLSAYDAEGRYCPLSFSPDPTYPAYAPGAPSASPRFDLVEFVRPGVTGPVIDGRVLQVGDLVRFRDSSIGAQCVLSITPDCEAKCSWVLRLQDAEDEPANPIGWLLWVTRDGRHHRLCVVPKRFDIVTILDTIDVAPPVDMSTLASGDVVVFDDATAALVRRVSHRRKGGERWIVHLAGVQPCTGMVVKWCQSHRQTGSAVALGHPHITEIIKPGQTAPKKDKVDG